MTIFAPSAASTEPIVVASVPESHVYVWHLSREDGEVVRRLPDPLPDESLRADQQGWWPPVMLRPGWARDNEFDVFHINFGFDACTPQQLQELVGVPAARGPRPGRAGANYCGAYPTTFGSNACPPEQLQELVDVLRDRGKPLVYTVHDLR